MSGDWGVHHDAGYARSLEAVDQDDMGPSPGHAWGSQNGEEGGTR